jgi:RHS repeat-associated protein
MVVEERHSAADPDRTGDHDTTVVRSEYTPVVTGDGDGWDLGMPTRTKTQLADGTWSTTVTRFDAQGRVIETRQPGGSAAADGSGNDAHATSTAYYTPGTPVSECDTTAQGHPERKEWKGLVCRVGPATQPDSDPTIPVTYTLGYNRDLQPTRAEERSGTTLRATVTEYDNAGRPIGNEQTVSNGDPSDQPLSKTTIGYASNGLPNTTTAGTEVVSTAYDSWGRTKTYTDALGTTSATTYTVDGQVATFNDGTGTYTYTYDGDGTGEHRRVPTRVDVGVTGQASTFDLSFTDAGQLATATYPNGLVATRGYDDAGAPTSLAYTQAGAEVLGFTAQVDVDGRTIAAGSVASEQEYGYDKLGRLTRVHDVRENGCTTRSYGFNASSDRTSFTSYAPGIEGACQETTPATSDTSSFDAAGRIRDTGYTYDNLGRTLTTPAADTAPGATGALTSGYFTNDMIASMTQEVEDGSGGSITKAVAYQLDPTRRINQVTNILGGTETSRLRYRFADDSDSPAAVDESSDGGTTWSSTRYLSIPGLGMAGSASNGALTLQLANMHGDIVATQVNQTGTTTIDTYTESDEYGNAVSTTTTGRYGWLGSHQRSTDAPGGLLLMGARVYSTVTGQFTTVDPILGGNSTAYSYPQDPVNFADPSGLAKILVRDWHLRWKYTRSSGWKRIAGIWRNGIYLRGIEVIKLWARIWWDTRVHAYYYEYHQRFTWFTQIRWCQYFICQNQRWEYSNHKDDYFESWGRMPWQ